MLTEVIACLNLGERVRLDWIQVQLPEGKVIDQCQSLARLSKVEEQAPAQRGRGKRDGHDEEFPEPKFHKLHCLVAKSMFACEVKT